jgi:hypothetical protein
LIDFAALNAITKVAADDPIGKHRMMDEIEERAATLAGPSPAPLLQSLAFTVALCEHDVRARQFVDGPLINSDLRQRNLDRSMRRYLAACRALATVQRLNTPNIQVNLAQNQIVATAELMAERPVVREVCQDERFAATSAPDGSQL